MQIKVLSLNSQPTSINFDEKLINLKPHRQALFDTVIAEQAALRQGTHSTLKKGEVRGGGKKPWAQKHTGKARQGSSRNPHWVGGGTAFGPKPERNYLVKLPKKVVNLALKSALSFVKDNIYCWSNSDSFDATKTKDVFKVLKTEKLANKKVLFVLDDKDIPSLANLCCGTVKFSTQVSARDLLNAHAVVFFGDSLNKMMKGLE